MNFQIIDMTAGEVAPEDLRRITLAADRYCCLVAHAWGKALPRVELADLQHICVNMIQVMIFKNSDEAGAAGYHATTPDGVPYARAFLDGTDSVLSGPDSLSSVITHEIGESVVDAPANLWALDGNGKLHALEACDAVEGDSFEIDGVSVSNFLYPAWFDTGAKGQYDYMGVCTGPFTLSTTKGAYEITAQLDLSTLSPAKQHPASRTYHRVMQLATI